MIDDPKLWAFVAIFSGLGAAYGPEYSQILLGITCLLALYFTIKSFDDDT
jgi:hypothetical protein